MTEPAWVKQPQEPTDEEIKECKEMEDEIEIRRLAGENPC